MQGAKECSDLEKLREAYRLWNETHGGSAQQWLDLMDDNVKMGSISDGAPGMEFTRSLGGKDQAKLYFQELHKAWEMLFFNAEEFIAAGDRIVVLSRVSFRSRVTGKTAESPKADFFRFRNGLIVEFYEFFDTAKAYAAASGC